MAQVTDTEGLTQMQKMSSETLALIWAGAVVMLAYALSMGDRE